MALKIKASRVAEGASEIILQSGNATIGTLHTNALVLESNCADSLHAIVSETIGATGEKMYILVHISQEFPTLLNGKPVTGSTHLSFGDKVEIGTTSLEMIEVPDESDEPDEQDEAQAPLSNGPRKPRTFDESDLFAESDVAGDRPQNEDPFAPPQSVPLKIGEFAEELSFLEKTKLTLQKAEEKVYQFARLKISRMQRQKVALDAPNEAEKKSDPTSEKQTETGPKSDENHVRVSQASPEFSAPPHSVAPVAGTLPIQVVEAKSELPPLPPLQPSPPLQPVLSKAAETCRPGHSTRAKRAEKKRAAAAAAATSTFASRTRSSDSKNWKYA